MRDMNTNKKIYNFNKKFADEIGNLIKAKTKNI